MPGYMTQRFSRRGCRWFWIWRLERHTVTSPSARRALSDIQWVWYRMDVSGEGVSLIWDGPRVPVLRFLTWCIKNVRKWLICTKTYLWFFLFFFFWMLQFYLEHFDFVSFFCNLLLDFLFLCIVCFYDTSVSFLWYWLLASSPNSTIFFHWFFC